MDLIKATDAHMVRKKFGLPRGSHFYPSEASVKFTDLHGIERVEGSCLRQQYYRITGEGASSGTDPYSQWIFALGSGVEQILIEQWKQMGIWVANSVRFYDKEHNISGELDAVLIDPENGQLFGVEVKSFYGYYAKKSICGDKKNEGRPKGSQLLQCLIYVDLCKKLGIIDYFKMIYYARDSADRAEFDINISVQADGKRYPSINGVIDYRFEIDDIYIRYAELETYLENKQLPPRDFSIKYSGELVEKLNAIGEIAKTNYEKWKKSPAKNPIGDWQCKYCSFSEHCWKENE